MGVNGLTSFLLKQCPDVVKEIPSRLKALSGKTVVIDATLLTQRLHFARSTIQNHHILRWYRLIADFKAHDVNVICVFDGKERNAAKIRELQRRREDKATSLARGKLEEERLHRLKTVHPVIHVLNELSPEGKREVRDSLRSRIQKEVEISEKTIKGLLDPSRTTLVKDAKEKWTAETVPMLIDGDTEPLSVGMEMEPTPSSEAPSLLVPLSPPESEIQAPIEESPSVSPFLLDQSPSSSLSPESTTTTDESDVLTPQEELTPSFPTANFLPEEPSLSPDLSLLPMEMEVEPTPLSGAPSLSVPPPPDLDMSGSLEEFPPPSTVPSFPFDQSSSSADSSLFPESTITTDESDVSTPQEELTPSSSTTPLLPDERSLSPDLSQSNAMETESPKRKRGRSIKRTPKAIASALTDLFDEYRESIASFETLRAPLPASSTVLSPEPLPETLATLEADPDFQTTASKNQIQIALEEGKEWQKLIADDFEHQEHVNIVFQNVIEKSEFLSDSYKRRNEYPTHKTYEDSRKLLLTMGVPCVQSEAPFEGEGLACAIVLNGYADFVVSEDMDVVLYGAPMLRGVTDRTKPLREIFGGEVPDALQLTREQFVDFGLLCGTDFTKRIPNVGPNRSFKLIKQHSSIEELLKNETKYRPSFTTEEYLTHVASARRIFNVLPPLPSIESLRPREMDQASVDAVLRDFGLRSDMLEEDQEGTLGSPAFEGDFFGDSPHKERLDAHNLSPVF